jgi:hypothetical protein
LEVRALKYEGKKLSRTIVSWRLDTKGDSTKNHVVLVKNLEVEKGLCPFCVSSKDLKKVMILLFFYLSFSSDHWWRWNTCCMKRLFNQTIALASSNHYDHGYYGLVPILDFLCILTFRLLDGINLPLAMGRGKWMV